MPSIKDKSTVDAIAREFTNNGRNKGEALRTVGYKDSYCDTRGIGVVYSHVRIIEAIAKIDAKTAKKYEHNQEIAITKLYEDYARLESKADAGDTVAIQARTAILRELNSCTGLSKQILVTQPQAPSLTASEQASIDADAAKIKLRLSG